MYQKGNKFYADWYDASGKRLRKSFTTERDAQLYEAAQKQGVHDGHPPNQPDHANPLHRRKAPWNTRSRLSLSMIGRTRNDSGSCCARRTPSRDEVGAARARPRDLPVPALKTRCGPLFMRAPVRCHSRHSLGAQAGRAYSFPPPARTPSACGSLARP